MYNRVGHMLKRAQAALRASMDEDLAAKDLNTPQFAALFALKQEPGLSNADLARRTFVTPQTMILNRRGGSSRVASSFARRTPRMAGCSRPLSARAERSSWRPAARASSTWRRACSAC